MKYLYHVGDLLSVDPSVNSPGAALFRDGELHACARVKIPAAFAGLDDANRCRYVSHEIVSWAYDFVEHAGEQLRAVIYEWPQVYTKGKQKGDPNDLPGLVAVGQGFAVGLQTLIGERRRSLRLPAIDPFALYSPRPREWAGTQPKVTSGDPRKGPRGARIWRCLRESERKIIPLQHDAFDSVGIGLWKLGRFSNFAAYAGAVD